MRFSAVKILITGLLICVSHVALATDAVLLSVKFIPSQKILHVRVKLSKPRKVKVFRLSHPARVVLDFRNTRLAKKISQDILPLPGVNKIRSGYPRRGTLRLVLDVDKKISFQKRSFAKSRIFNLDLYPFGEIKKIPISAKVKKARTLNIKKIRRHGRQVVVVVDPGHGGRDPGANGPAGTHEKKVALAIAKKLASEINKTSNMRAVLTRKGDYYVPLRGRLRLARKSGADIFISIHADAFLNAEASGASAYALSRHGATSEAARWLAGRENDSELAGVDLKSLADQSAVLRSVLIDLAQTATIRDSLHLGQLILRSIKPVAKLHYRRVEQAPFMVLKSPDIPSILVETGFLSNKFEERRLGSPVYQKKMAHAICLGLKNYLKKYPPAGSAFHSSLPRWGLS